MTDTLFNIIHAVARHLDMFTGVATGGSTTTIVDTTYLTQTDDYWNQGTALIITDAGGANAAPEGEWGVISDFVASSDTLTISAVSAAVAAGDIYGIIPPRFSLDHIRNAINGYLIGLKIPKNDSTSLDSADDQTEYTLPAAVTAQNLRRVFYQGQTDDANDNQWIEIRDVQVIMTGVGVQDVLILPQLPSGRDIRLEYVGIQPALHLSTDTIDENIHLQPVVMRALQNLYAREISWEDNFKAAAQMANYYADLAERAERRHPIKLPNKNGRIISHPYDGVYKAGTIGTVGKVDLS